MADYTVLSTQLAKATPSATASSAYVVSNTVAQACPATGTAWAASENLPPIADAELCSCMVASLSCIADTGLSSNETSDLFSTVCGLDENACDGITGNATTGVYGAYSMCDSYSMLSFAFNQYYLTQSKASTACDFGSKAKTQTASTASSCSSLLSQAGTAGTGTVTSVATGTGVSSSSGSSATTSKASAGNLRIPTFDMGMLKLGAYLLCAAATGVGMVLL